MSNERFKQLGHFPLMHDVCTKCGATSFQKVLTRCPGEFIDEDRLTHHREELEAQRETEEAR